MKTSLNLSIAKPCAENWNTFTPSGKGRFCGSCRKVVIDFTTASDDEILNFLQNKPAHACGRFKAVQLKTYSTVEPPKLNTGFALLKAGTIGLLLLFISKPTVAQKSVLPVQGYVQQSDAFSTAVSSGYKTDHIIKGVVRDEGGFPLPGVSVVLKGTNVGTQTNINGEFEFPQKLKQGDVLAFYFIGFKTKEYKIPNQDRVVIELALEMDMEIMGELAVTELYVAKESFVKRIWNKARHLF